MEEKQEQSTEVTAEQLLQRYAQENTELRFELMKLQIALENKSSK